MGTTPKARGRHILTVQTTLAHIEELRAIAARDDCTVSQLVRRGVRHVLAEESEAATPAKGGGPEDVARTGASRVLR